MKFASHCKRIKVITIFLFFEDRQHPQFFVYDFIYLKFKIVLTMIITQRQYGTYEIFIVRFFLTQKSFYLN